jgi:hypothetical protein
MIRRSIPILPLILALLGTTTHAQQAGRAYKVAFWFEIDRPFSSLQYRAYDLAKGEYDAANVERWRRTILDKHPQYGAIVRDLTTVGEPGATEAERLANAVDREKKRWIDLNSRESRPLPKLVGPAPSIKSRDKGVSRASFDLPSPGSPGPISNTPASPFPYPYRSGPR